MFGNVIHTEPRTCTSRASPRVNGGLPHETGALTVNRLCGSGLQAIVSASQYILLGDTDAAVGGGAESMSRAAYATSTQRWGARMGDGKIDRHDGRRADRSVRHRPHGHHRGERRDEVRASRASSRTRSPSRATAARGSGDRRRPLQDRRSCRSSSRAGRGRCMFDTDEHVRGDATAEGMAKLRAVFAKENGTVTAGNASGINDAAAAVVLMEKQAAQRSGPEADGAARRLRPRRHRSRRSWASARCSAVKARAGEGRPEDRRHRRRSNRTKRSPRRRSA